MLIQAMLFFQLLKEHANVYALCNAYSNVLFNFNALMYAIKFQNILAPESTSIGVLRYIIIIKPAAETLLSLIQQ
jgi:hypothetical protein